MKKVLAVCCLGAVLPGSFGQGLINFVNGPGTLISDGTSGGGMVLTSGPGHYEFALLTSPVGANDFTFAGVYATNQAVAGLINGGSGVAVHGWAPGTARDFFVVGWNAWRNGTTYNPSWLNPDLTLGANYYRDGAMPIGGSSIQTGVAGGVTSSGILPNLDIFGGVAGIQNGFALFSFVPEPSTTALAAWGMTVILVFRRRIGPEPPDCTEPRDCDKSENRATQRGGGKPGR